MKVALIDPSLFTWPYDHALADGLRRNGHEVVLYARHLAANEQGKGDPGLCEFFYPGFQTRIMKKLPRKLFLALKGIAHIFCMAALWIKLWLEKPSIIHFQWTPLAVIDRYYIPLFRRLAPVILTVHDSSPFNNNPSAGLQRIGAIDIMSAFDHLIVHTEKAREALNRYGLNPATVSRIDHGLIDHLPNTPTPTSTGSTGTPVTLLLFGQIKPYKGTDLLLQALGLLPPALRSVFRLRVVGKPQMDMQPLLGLADQLGLQSQIEWDLRFIDEDEIPALFAAADIMVMPYREIDASGVLMQAMAIGRPIVATRIGLFSELLQDGVHGYLVDPESPQALADALSRLIADKDLRLELGKNVLALRTAIPSWQEIARTTTEVYNALAANAS